VDGNGVTRREFDKLETKVDVLYDKGSPQLRALERELETEMRNMHDDFKELQGAVDRRLQSVYRVAVGILIALVGGLITLLTALASGAFQ